MGRGLAEHVIPMRRRLARCEGVVRFERLILRWRLGTRFVRSYGRLGPVGCGLRRGDGLYRNMTFGRQPNSRRGRRRDCRSIGRCCNRCIVVPRALLVWLAPLYGRRAALGNEPCVKLCEHRLQPREPAYVGTGV